MNETKPNPPTEERNLKTEKLNEWLKTIQKYRSRYGWGKFLALCFLSGVTSFIYASYFLDLEIGNALVKASIVNEHVSQLTHLLDIFPPKTASMVYTLSFVYAGTVIALHCTYDFFNKDYTKAKLPMNIIGEAGGFITTAAITPAAIHTSLGLGIVLALATSTSNLGLKENAQETLLSYNYILLSIAVGFLACTIFFKKYDKFPITKLSIQTSMHKKLISSRKKSLRRAIGAFGFGVLTFIGIEIIQVKGTAESWSSLANLVTDYCIGENVCGTCPAKD
jgi:hypothetical protein